jgi:serine O-acetyltransferase
VFNDNIASIVEGITKNYEADEIFFTKAGRTTFPSRNVLKGVIYDIRRIMFPGYFGTEALDGLEPDYFVGDLVNQVGRTIREQIFAALTYRDGKRANPVELRFRADQIAGCFIERLPEIQRMLLTDVQAFFDGDPAAQSKEDIIFSYPGLFAIFVYRIAHELYVQDVPLIPRIMTEFAHSKTGVDINAGATIDEYFMIDHATGVVIGETTQIGKHVKIYQGVTLGALSLRKGQGLRGKKRHPTIEDNVTVYSNASVLGPVTIGEGSVIGGSAFVTEDVPRNGRVSTKQEVTISTPDA